MSRYNQPFFEALTPPPDFDVRECADKHRYLSTKTSAMPGPWRTSVVPYTREPMELLSRDSGYDTVVLMWPSQSSKTEVLLNTILHTMLYNPQPILCVQPTLGMAKKFSKQRVQSLINDCPEVSDLITNKTRNKDNTLFSKSFPGGVLFISGSNSPASLASMPIGVVLLDEVDRYELDVKGEGSPMRLAIRRADTFPDRKILITSTPTIKGRSAIEREYESSDKRILEVPCPDCSEYQDLRWERLDYKTFGVQKPVYRCLHCEAKIEEIHKHQMIANHRWRATAEGRPGKAGFHKMGLSSPFAGSAWPVMVDEWKSAQKNPNELKVFVNTRLAQTWESRGDQPDWEKVFSRRGGYSRGEVPEGVSLLTAGVDMQKDRLEVEVVGWGPRMESWSIDYYVIMGETTEEEIWRKLEDIKNKQYDHELGGTISISTMCIDSGYNPQPVYKFCRGYHPTEVVAIKGQDNLPVAIGRPTKVDLTSGGKTIHNGATLRKVGTDLIKGELYGWMLKARPEKGDKTPYGWCHFPEDYQEEYFKQLCSEKQVVKTKRGRLNYAWEKTRERNEALDCRVYARAAATACGIDHYTPERWQEMRERCKPVEHTTDTTAKGRRNRRRKGEYSYE